jgi:hypothetical protein
MDGRWGEGSTCLNVDNKPGGSLLLNESGCRLIPLVVAAKKWQFFSATGKVLPLTRSHRFVEE